MSDEYWVLDTECSFWPNPLTRLSGYSLAKVIPAEAVIQKTVAGSHATGFLLALCLIGMTTTILSTHYSVLSTFPAR